MWTFEISTGKFFDPTGAFVSKGYAGGNEGKNPEGINNPEMTGVKDIGPLPEGLYTMGEPVEHSRLGPFAVPLTPDPANEMFGRGGFFCHGDTAALDHSASEGCIILPRAIRELAWNSSDHRLQVVRTFSAN